MEKRLTGLVCCALLCTGLLTAPASAASMVGQSQFNDGEYAFQKVDIELSGLGSGYALLVDASQGLHPEDNAYFSDGTLLIYDASTQSYNYLGADGKLHDLNQGRFVAMCPFSEGLAAVIDEDGKMGFIDPTGKLVIPCQFETLTNQVSEAYGSFFQSGTAWAFRYDQPYGLAERFANKPISGTFTKIDTSGKFLSGTEQKVSISSFGPQSKEINTYGLFCPGGSAKGLTEFTEACTAPVLGSFQARFGSADTGLTYLPTGAKDAYGNPKTQLYVVSREEMQRTAGRPEFYYVKSVDDGFGINGRVGNATEASISGRWGFIVTVKDNDGTYTPYDASILEYTLAPRSGGTQIAFRSQAPLTDHQLGKISLLNDNIRLVYVNLNSDSDYDRFLSEVTPLCAYGTATEEYPNQKDTYLGEFQNEAASSAWLYKNFAGALK